MKSATSISIVIACVSFPASAFQNEPGGFRSIDWGTSIETVKDDFEAVASPRPNELHYLRKGDRLQLGAVSLKSLHYSFYKGRFFSVFMMSQPGVANKVAMRDAFMAQFGPGDQPNRFMDRWFWFGSRATMSLNCLNPDGSCSALLMSTALNNEKKADDATTAKGAAKDF